MESCSGSFILRPPRLDIYKFCSGRENESNPTEINFRDDDDFPSDDGPKTPSPSPAKPQPEQQPPFPVQSVIGEPKVLCGVVRGKTKNLCHCGKVFVQAAHLNRHVNNNMNPKTFRCSKCGKFFSQRSDLKRHMAGFHKGITFQCTYCEARFTYRYPLVLHCMRKHPGMELPPKSKRGALQLTGLDN